MNDNKNQENQSRQQERKTSKFKKPYTPPTFRRESLAFETMALSCGKISSTQAQCKSNIKNS